MSSEKEILVPSWSNVAHKQNVVSPRVYNRQIIALMTFKMDYAIFMCARDKSATNLPWNDNGIAQAYSSFEWLANFYQHASEELIQDYFRKFKNRLIRKFKIEFGRANIQDIAITLIFMKVHITSKSTLNKCWSSINKYVSTRIFFWL